MLCLFVATALTLLPQVADHANGRYRTKEGREAVAKGLGAHNREETQKPQDLVAALKLTSGMTVVDVGTGVGFMLPYLSRAVSPGGKVIAEDIFPDFLAKAAERVKEKELGNVELVQGTDRDAKLPVNSADVILILDAFHHFDYPAEMLAGIHKSLKPGGRLAIVEFYKEHFGDPKHIRFTEEEMVKEVAGYGFELISTRPFIEKRQFLSEFRKR
jgi:ubiquinone/menaquinone biosynthesis C-methylase UbiE